MAIRHEQVMEQIKAMLGNIKEVDEQQHMIILELLNLVFVEYNTKKNMNVDRKLYELIDAEVRRGN